MWRTRDARIPFWRWRHNALRRPSDIAEAWVVLVAWVLAIAGGTATGLACAWTVEDTLARQRVERQEVSAVLTADAPRTVVVSPAGQTDARVPAEVSWTGADGAVHHGRALVDPGTPTGTAVSVWTDGTERITSAPASPLDAAVRTVLLGTFAGAGSALLVLAVGRMVRWRMEDRSVASWGPEWEQVGPMWRRTTS
ncbi:hypothetical protein [Streptomyces sp. GC420]|uniref:Rv1733c family protein n=1 Tax=Streptomyces sp. GC420 TaxID=2697568 RepID=UPI001414E62B|nr:hypothetical protein [Streptomyces sp. GC420]NBM18834.1 hypothetical protein [Streptomyces sp. GC420]